MDIEIFCFCDGAFNYDGKLTIVGTYDQLLVNTIPQKVRLSVALKLNIQPNEINDGSKFILSFKDTHGNQVAKDVVNEIKQVPHTGEIIHLAMVINIELNVSEVGIHRVELSFNDKLLKTKLLPVALRG